MNWECCQPLIHDSSSNRGGRKRVPRSRYEIIVTLRDDFPGWVWRSATPAASAEPTRRPARPRREAGRPWSELLELQLDTASIGISQRKADSRQRLFRLVELNWTWGLQT